MRKFNYFIFVFICCICFNILNVNAATRKEKAEEALAKYHFDFKYVNMEDNFKMVTESKEFYGKVDDWFRRMLIRSDLEKIIDFEKNDAIDIFCYLKGEEYTKSIHNEDGTYSYVKEIADQDKCEVDIYFVSENDSIESFVTGKFTEVEGNIEYKKEALGIAKNIQKDVYVTDLDIINHSINYETTTSSFFDGNNALTEFANLKKAVEANPNYDFSIGIEDVRRGDYFVGLEEGITYISRDGIVYGFALNTYGAGTIFYVPMNTLEKDYENVLTKRIESYINNKDYKIKVEKIVAYEWENNQKYETSVVNAGNTVLNILGLTQKEYYNKYNTNLENERKKVKYNKEYCTEEYGCIAVPIYKLTINDMEYEIGIIPVSDDVINSTGVITSQNKDTGIIIKTSAGNVPLDAMLDVKDLKITDKEIEFLKEYGYKHILGYDFKLYSNILNKFISNFNIESEILIPVVNITQKNLKIVYISDDLKTIEKYDIEFVNIEDKQYMSFKTKHFSNYILVEEEEKEDANPETGDSINGIYLLLIISLLGLFSLPALSKNKK